MASLLLLFIVLFCNVTFGTYLHNYDYIVVGSGPGGAPLAARLGLAGNKVLVIEAGSDVETQDWNISVPLFNSKASEDSRISWDFFVRPADP
jgi:choline dehydrogenase